MGRPRKHRPAVEHAAPLEGAPKQESPAAQPPPFVVPGFEFDPTIGMDLDLSFLDVGNEDFNFLQLINPGSEFPTGAAAAAAAAAVQPGTSEHTTPSLDVSLEGSQSPADFWPMNNQLGNIGFDAPPNYDPAPQEQQQQQQQQQHPPPPRPQDLGLTTDEVARMLSANVSEKAAASFSPASANSPSTSSPAPAPAVQDNPPTCGCLSALYLALDSLRELPKGIVDAMRVARTAAKTAHDTVLCPVCGDPPLDPTRRSPITSLQSMMMLGALLPSLSNAYTRILAMVDAEAAAAEAERRKIRFTLSSYGGLWGWLTTKQGVDKCGGAERLDGAVMDPIVWRLTVRSLLKMDVYGVNDLTPGIELPGVRQPGLKDIIAMMEERSHRRHVQIDALVATGTVDKLSKDYVPLSSPHDKPTCMKIIDIAKQSMDDLVIP